MGDMADAADAADAASGGESGRHGADDPSDPVRSTHGCGGSASEHDERKASERDANPPCGGDDDGHGDGTDDDSVDEVWEDAMGRPGPPRRPSRSAGRGNAPRPGARRSMARASPIERGRVSSGRRAKSARRVISSPRHVSPALSASLTLPARDSDRASERRRTVHVGAGGGGLLRGDVGATAVTPVVMITGGYGYLGRYLTKELVRLGWRVIQFDVAIPRSKATRMAPHPRHATARMMSSSRRYSFSKSSERSGRSGSLSPARATAIPQSPSSRASTSSSSRPSMCEPGEGGEAEATGSTSRGLPWVVRVCGSVLKAEELADVISMYAVQTVFHLATLRSSASVDRSKTWRVNVEGTQNVLEACIRCGVRQLIFSSTARVVYRGVDIMNGTEGELEIPDEADAFNTWTASKACAERMVLDADKTDTAKGTRLRTLVLRPAAIFGPDNTYFIGEVFRQVQMGVISVMLGNGQNIVDLTYVGNVVIAFVCAVKAMQRREDQVCGKAYFITNDAPVRFWDVVKMVFDHCPDVRFPRRMFEPDVAWGLAAMWRPTPTTFFQRFLHWLGFDHNSWILSNAPLTRNMVAWVTTHCYFSCERAKRLLGYRPLIPMESGLAHTMQVERVVPIPRMDSDGAGVLHDDESDGTAEDYATPDGTLRNHNGEW